jgi:hypothetical protein
VVGGFASLFFGGGVKPPKLKMRWPQEKPAKGGWLS